MSALPTEVRAGAPATWRERARRGALAAGALVACSIGIAHAQVNVTVTTEAELRQAILDANAAPPGSTITLGDDIVLTQSLPMMRNDVTVFGSGRTIDANNGGRVFFIGSGTVSIQDLTVANARAQGGAAGSGGVDSGGGGGGLGAGAALFVDTGANVTVANFTIADAQALGGAGGAGGAAGSSGAGGGGGLGGSGGAAGPGATGGPGGGGGYAGVGGAGGASVAAGGGGGEFGAGGAGAGTGGGHGGGGGQSGNGGAGGSGGGGGGGGSTASGSDGAALTGGAGGIPEGGTGGDLGASGAVGAARGGGGGAGSGVGTFGGAGGVSGGGGGGVTGGTGGTGGGGGGGTNQGGAGGELGGGGGGPLSGGSGGFGGGGGGSGLAIGTGAPGGFGAGGGAGAAAGVGGSFGGAGGTVGGGGGAAVGGAIFVRAGGILTITDGAFTGTFGVTGGSAGGTADGSTAGQALGTVLFLDGVSGVANATTIAVGSGNTLTIGGNDALAGSGGLIKFGPGTLVLGGANASYSGGVTLSDGTLAVGSNGALGTGTLTSNSGALSATGGARTVDNAVTVNAGGMTVSGADDLTLSGVVSGPGALTKTGGATLTLAGANTYTGGTAINAGTVSVGSDGNLGGAAGGLVFDGGTLRTTAGMVSGREIALNAGGGTIDTAGNDSTLSGVISGAGGLTKAGAGVLTLSGANTYTGGTTVGGGTLYGDATSLQGAIANNAQVVFDQVSDGIYAGVMGGTGGVTKAGAGVLTLAGANTYAGGTAVSAGTVRMGAGGSLPSTGAVVVSGGAALDLNGTSQTVGSLAGAGDVTLGAGVLTAGDDNTSTTFSGVISGTGGLTKQGTGTFTLQGANTYTGTTTSVGGTFFVNGSLAGPVMLGSGGLLGGTGSIGGDVAANGRLAPGTSIGTLAVAGNLTFGAGAVYEVEVNATGQSDGADVTGTATLTGARVAVLPEPGPYRRSTSYTILTAAGGLVGVFDRVTSSLALLEPTLSYDANNVFLTLLQSRTFASAGHTANQREVGGAVDVLQAGATGDLATLIDQLFMLTVPEARSAFDRLSGELHATAQTIQLEGSGRWTEPTRERLAALRAGLPPRPASLGRIYAEAPAGPSREVGRADTTSDIERLPPPAAERRRSGAWVRGYGGRGELNGDGNAAGAEYQLAGAGVGADVALSRSLWLGTSAGYTQADVHVDGRRDETAVDSYQIGVYGGYGREAWLLDGFLGYAFNEFDALREVTFGAVDRRATAKYDGFEITARAEVGYAAVARRVRLEPRLGLTYTRLWQDGFSERGADAANLIVDETTVESLGASVGLRAGREFSAANRVSLVPTGRLRYTRELLDDAPVIDARLAGATGGRFRVRGLEMPRDRVELGAGLQATIGSRVVLALDYTADIASGRNAHFGSATINVAW